MFLEALDINLSRFIFFQFQLLMLNLLLIKFQMYSELFNFLENLNQSIFLIHFLKCWEDF